MNEVEDLYAISMHPNSNMQRLLYMYQNENQQLSTQIKGLTQRLNDILATPLEKTPTKELSPEAKVLLIQQAQLTQEINRLHGQIKKVQTVVQTHKEAVSEDLENKCIQLQNDIRNQEIEIAAFKRELESLQNQSNIERNACNLLESKAEPNQNKVRHLESEIETVRRRVRELQKKKHNLVKLERSHHEQVVGLQQKIRTAASPIRQPSPEPQKKKSTVWALEYSEENYSKIQAELHVLKTDKQNQLDSLENENLLLRGRLVEISAELQSLSKSHMMPPLFPKEIDLQIIKLKESSKQQELAKLQKAIESTPRRQVLKSPLLSSDFDPFNDKNFVPKKAQQVQWRSEFDKGSTIEWNDSVHRSCVIGANFWFDGGLSGGLTGLQFIYKQNSSEPHLQQMEKKTIPIQYRLPGGDYLENMVLMLAAGRIVGLEMRSKLGRVDQFGKRQKSNRFDFSIKKPQKPVFAFGRLRMGGSGSQVVALGFEVI